MTLSEITQGIYIGVNYLAPRKRKPSKFSRSAESFEQAFQLIKEYKEKNGGKFLNGFYIECERQEMKIDNVTTYMVSVPYGKPGINLTEKQIEKLNA